MSEIRIDYQNTPVGAMEDATTTGTYGDSFVNYNDFKTNRVVPKYATLEPNYWLLDGTFNNFPNNPTGLGYMSTIMSDSNGDFSNTITLTRTYTSAYTSPRI